jgi:small GTP-binding protein
MEESQAKIVLVGDSGVGKSSILDMLINSKFYTNVESTVGSAFKTKEIEIGKKTVKLNIWDTAGQERYNSLTKMYCRGAMAAVMVYDITKRDTFLNLRKWYQVVLESGNTDLQFVIVGNKEDLIDREEIPMEEAQNFAHKIGAIFKKTSARSNFGIEDLFQSVAFKVFPELSNNAVAKQRVIDLTEANPRKNCCLRS